MTAKFFISSFVVLLFITGCNFSDMDEKNIETKKVIFTVDPSLLELTYTFKDGSREPIISYCLKLTDEKTNELYALSPQQVKGFSYTEGYQYRIKVLVTFDKRITVDPVENVVITPGGYNFGGGKSYELIEVLSKIKTIN